MQHNPAAPPIDEDAASGPPRRPVTTTTLATVAGIDRQAVLEIVADAGIAPVTTAPTDDPTPAQAATDEDRWPHTAIEVVHRAALALRSSGAPRTSAPDAEPGRADATAS